MKKRFARDYSEILEKQRKIKQQRENFISVQSISDKQPLTVLEGLIKMWPTHDIRYKGYGTCDDTLMVDMIKGAEVRTTRKDMTKGILELTVEMVKNLDEIERYNAAIAKHNREWKKQGSPKKVFDPVHGDSFEVKDQFIDPVMMQSKHYDLPDSAYSGVSTGRLAKVRPDISRKSHIRVKYQMSIIEDNKFVLGYAAYDYEDRIIYYNQFIHKDLAYLVRRSVQEIWGNPTAHWEFDRLLEGITMLLNGKKMKICKRDNKLPEFLAYEDTKIKGTSMIQSLEAEVNKQIHLANVTGFNIPIFFIIGFVVCALWSFINMGVEFDPEKSFQIYIPLLLCILFLVGTILCRIVSQDSDRNVSKLEARKKFL